MGIGWDRDLNRARGGRSLDLPYLSDPTHTVRVGEGISEGKTCPIVIYLSCIILHQV